MKSLPKEKRDRLLLIVISTLILVALVWQGLISLQKKKLASQSQKRAEAASRATNGKRLVDSIEEIKKQLADQQGNLKKIESEMASGDMYSWLITKVNQFKANYDVEIPQFSREVQTGVGIFAEFPYKAALFNIRGKAFYHDLGRFVADFENAFPYMRIQNIELEPANSASAAAIGGDPAREHPEKLAFRMEIVTLINPNTL